MKSTIEWIYSLSQPHQDLAISYTSPEQLQKQYKDFTCAIINAFDFNHTPEKDDYWWDIANNPQKYINDKISLGEYAHKN